MGVNAQERESALKTKTYSGLAFRHERNPLYLTRDEVRVDLFQYIEGFYNRRRRHASIGYLTPEQMVMASQAAASAA
jgi:transposase InsO family protein